MYHETDRGALLYNGSSKSLLNCCLILNVLNYSVKTHRSSHVKVENWHSCIFCARARFGAAIKITAKNMCGTDENNNPTPTSSANKASDEGGRLEMKDSAEM